MSRVLVTGARGFIGRNALGPLLARGYEVHAVSSRPVEPGDGEVTWHHANLLEAGASAAVLDAARASHLLHLAWYTAPGSYWESPQNLRWAESSADLMRRFAELGGHRAVIAGTCAEYDWGGDGLLSETSTPLHPATLYGSSKHELHGLAADIARDRGASLAWARLFFLYGPHESPERLVASIARTLLSGKPAPCTDGEQVRDYLYAPDAGEALAAVLDSNVEGSVNVASGEPRKVREVIELVGGAVGRPELIRLGELRRPAGEPPELFADVARLRDEVGWTPATGLGEGIERTVDWWRERLSSE